jgi:hypothetical protein
MVTLVIDRQILPEPHFSFIGAGADKVQVTKERGGVFLAPVAELDNDEYIDGPDSRYIDPADYASDTEYLNALPGIAERIVASMNAPASEFTTIPQKRYSHYLKPATLSG